MEMIVLLVMILLSRIGWEMDLVHLVPLEFQMYLEPVVIVIPLPFSLILIVFVSQVTSSQLQVVRFVIPITLRPTSPTLNLALLVLISWQIPSLLQVDQPTPHFAIAPLINMSLRMGMSA